MALNLTLKVHPVVLFQIVDAFERRNARAYRVIGTLLGKFVLFYFIRYHFYVRFPHYYELHIFEIPLIRRCCPGSVEKGVVEATNCFCVPHKEHEDIVNISLFSILGIFYVKIIQN